MSEIVYIVVPIVVVVVLLKVCLIGWRVWACSQRQQRMSIPQQPPRVVVRGQRASGPAVARVVRVERCVTNNGAVAQRTSYAINQPGLPQRQFQRTVVIQPADNRRPNDPNIPPSYDMAVSGKDKSVAVENGPRAEPTLRMEETTPPISVPSYELSNPPAYSSVPRAPRAPPTLPAALNAQPTLPAALEEEEEEEEVAVGDTTRLLS